MSWPTRIRTSLYELAHAHKGLLKKFGAKTLVNIELLDSILEALPDAEFANRGQR
jgi:hypothetical protein